MIWQVRLANVSQHTKRLGKEEAECATVIVSSRALRRDLLCQHPTRDEGSAARSCRSLASTTDR
jgi:hypothetical protein